MAAPLDDRYLEWLYSHYGAVRFRSPSQSYWKLSRLLYSREFVWFIANDDNRLADGLDLRVEFMNVTGSEPDELWSGLGCSTLEVLVALAKRGEFETSEALSVWMHRFFENLNLSWCTDAAWSPETEEHVTEVLDALIFRTYDSTGAGGLFPLRRPHQNQTRVELWSQMAAYIYENDLI